MAQTTILQAAGLTAPVMGALSTATTGGTLAAGTYYYRVSAINALGECLPAAEVSKTTTGTTSTVTVTWTKSTDATGYKIYGRDTGAELLLETLGDVATFTDDGSDTPAGAMPTVDTSGGDQAATSSDFTVTAGTPLVVALFTDDPDGIDAEQGLSIYQDSPSSIDVHVADLTGGHPRIVLTGAGTYRCRRPAGPTRVGVFTE